MTDIIQQYKGKDNTPKTRAAMATSIAALEADLNGDLESFKAVVDNVTPFEYAQLLDMHKFQTELLLSMLYGPFAGAGAYATYLAKMREGVNDLLAKPA